MSDADQIALAMLLSVVVFVTCVPREDWGIALALAAVLYIWGLRTGPEGSP